MNREEYEKELRRLYSLAVDNKNEPLAFEILKRQWAEGFELTRKRGVKVTIFKEPTYDEDTINALCGLLSKEKPLSIEQELEVGLIYRSDHKYWVWNEKLTRYDLCTRIFLPREKYLELINKSENVPHCFSKWHNIPIFSVKDLKEIVFCTNER